MYFIHYINHRTIENVIYKLAYHRTQIFTNVLEIVSKLQLANIYYMKNCIKRKCVTYLNFNYDSHKYNNLYSNDTNCRWNTDVHFSDIIITKYKWHITKHQIQLKKDLNKNTKCIVPKTCIHLQLHTSLQISLSFIGRMLPHKIRNNIYHVSSRVNGNGQNYEIHFPPVFIVFLFPMVSLKYSC